MNITLLSDLHLEFKNPVSAGEGDVLILAGDITTVDTVKKDADFFRRAADNYNLVVYVPGNHEYYHSDIGNAWDIITEQIDDRIIPLNNQSTCYQGVHFVGSTMWTDMNRGSGATMQQAAQCMSDYHIVTNGAQSLAPADTLALYDTSVRWFEQVLPTLRGDVVMVTHHAPSLTSVEAPGYGSNMQHAYATDMDDFIRKYQSIRLWCHGHAHRKNDYMIGTTRILANPCGYFPDSMTHEFDPNLTVPVRGVSNSTCPNA